MAFCSPSLKISVTRLLPLSINFVLCFPLKFPAFTRSTCNSCLPNSFSSSIKLCFSFSVNNSSFALLDRRVISDVDIALTKHSNFFSKSSSLNQFSNLSRCLAISCFSSKILLSCSRDFIVCAFVSGD